MQPNAIGVERRGGRDVSMDLRASATQPTPHTLAASAPRPTRRVTLNHLDTPSCQHVIKTPRGQCDGMRSATAHVPSLCSVVPSIWRHTALMPTQPRNEANRMESVTASRCIRVSYKGDLHTVQQRRCGAALQYRAP